MRSVLIANRGEIAVRVARACFDEGLHCVLAASEADKDSLAAKLVDRVVLIGPAPAAESYLSVERIVAAALHAGCDAIHPGYGFLSERPELPEACAENGITFIGPPGEVMRRSGDKLAARDLAAGLGIPTGGGTDALPDGPAAEKAAADLDDFPLIMKASAGGGGRGMRIVREPAEVGPAFDSASEEALRAFGDGRVYLERYVENARHVEVQILADTHGTVVHLGERDCSTQRGTRSSSRRRRRPAWTAHSSKASAPPRCSCARNSAMSAPAPSSSWSTSTAATSSSSNSTRACRSSTRSRSS